jgi:hypothetical protein
MSCVSYPLLSTPKFLVYNPFTCSFTLQNMADFFDLPGNSTYFSFQIPLYRLQPLYPHFPLYRALSLYNIN